jgi:hypothetical protein
MDMDDITRLITLMTFSAKPDEVGRIVVTARQPLVRVNDNPPAMT